MLIINTISRKIKLLSFSKLSIKIENLSLQRQGRDEAGSEMRLFLRSTDQVKSYQPEDEIGEPHADDGGQSEIDCKDH